MARPPDPLQPARDRLRRLDLHDEVDGAHVDAELERRRGNQCRNLAGLEGVFDLEPLLAGDRAVVGAHQLLAREIVDAGREALGEAPRVDEDQRRVVLADQLEQGRSNRRPDRVAHLGVTGGRSFHQTRVHDFAELPHVLDGHDNFQIEGLADAGVDDGDRPGPPFTSVVTGAAPEKPGDLVERTLRGRQPDPLQAVSGQFLKPLQREEQVRSPLRRHQRMDLVDDHRLDRTEDLARLGGEEQVERLGRGDQDVGRMADDVAPLARRCVARARRRAQRGQHFAGALSLEGDTRQRRAQIAVHVVGQGLQRRHVQHAAPLLLRRRLLGKQAVDHPQEGGEGLPRPRGGEDQCVLALADGFPALLLRRCRLGEGALEPGASQRREPIE